MHKIVIFGAGAVGEATALELAKGQYAQELLLVDVAPGLAAGIALDIHHASTIHGFDTEVSGTNDAREIKNADLVIITAGAPRRPGMSRTDLLHTNAAIIREIIAKVAENAPDALLIMVTNPADILTYYSWRLLEWPRERIMGMSGVLDSARMAAYIADQAKCSVKNVTAMVIGGHGDTMVPLTEYSYINGIPITQFLSDGIIRDLTERTRKSGTEILNLKKRGTACLAPAASISLMVDAIVNNRKRILPSIGLLDGEYGLTDIALCVPCQFGKNGLEKIVELPLTDSELALLEHSIADLKNDIVKLNQFIESQ
ncbi:MAG: malate dehydrogenase [Gammaproteobacteria bacterium SG8_11]|nr:MAG: malate dehydrogenase [Gammaproteobacteria bacterium SG8_11]